MLDPFNDTRRYLVWSFILIIFLLVTGIAVADTKDKVIDVLDKIEKIENDDSVYFDKIVSVEPKKVAGQYCYVNIIIMQKGDTIEKEEISVCADGR